METDAGFVERFKSLYPDGNLSAFARKVGIGASTLQGYADGALPRLDKVVLIARAEKVSVHWLATGEGPRDIPSSSALPEVGTQQEHASGGLMQISEGHGTGLGMVMLPRLSVRPSAGLGLVAVSEEVERLVALSEAYLRQIGVEPQHAHVLQVDGRSMVPTINDKDVVVVDTSKTAIISEGIYTLVYGDAVLVKRIRMLRDGSVTIVSDNKSEGYGDEYVSRAEMNTLRIVGQVKGQVRAL